MSELPPPPDNGYVPPSFPGYPPPPQYPPQYPPQGPGWYRPPPSRTLAIVALVLAILPTGISWIAAIVLGIIALVQVRKGAAAGKGMAIAALVVSCAWIALVAVVVTLGVRDLHQYDDARAAGSGRVWVDMVEDGDCLVGLPHEELIGEVEIIPCTEPHVGEVFAVFPIDAGPDPSQDDIDALTEAGCLERFQAFVGVSSQDSELGADWISPTPDLMNSDNEAICYLWAPDAPTTGTLQESNR